MNSDQSHGVTYDKMTLPEFASTDPRNDQRLPGARLFWFTNCLLLATLICMFWPCLSNSSIPSFRDTKTFYYPMWVWEDANRGSPSNSFSDNAARGETLEWNRFVGTGVSVIGEPTSQSAYPPSQLIKYFFAGKVATQIGMYTVLHLSLAGLMAGLSIRMLGLSWQAATFGTVVMSLCGPVFFQIYNLIYLVGATWSPLAVCSLFVAVTPHSPRHSPRLNLRRRLPILTVSASAWALLILGGDVQSFANGWVLLITALPFFWMQKHCRLADILMSCACVISMSAGLASVQILPTLDWVSFSSRSNSLSHVYEFSVAPWHLVTYVWPSFLGSFTNGHSRWSAVFADEPRMWFPSHYCGTLTFVLAVCLLIGYATKRIRLAATSRRVFRLGLLVLVLGTMFSFGEFGFGWLIGLDSASSELQQPHSPAEQAAFLGPYWIATKLLPGYSQFRYPAKWAVIASFGLVVMGSLGFEQFNWSSSSAKKIRSWTGWGLCVVGLFSLLGCLITTVWPSLFEASFRLENIPDDFYLGQFNQSQAQAAIQFGLLLAGVSGLLTGASLLLDGFSSVGNIVIWLLFVDLVLANQRELHFVSTQAISNLSSGSNDSSKRPMALGRLNLLDPIRSIDSQFSIQPKAIAAYRQSNVHSVVELSKLSWLNPETAILKCKQAGDFVVPILPCTGWSVRKAVTPEQINQSKNLIPVVARDFVFSQVSVAEPCVLEFHYDTPRLVLGRSISTLTLVCIVTGLVLSRRYRKQQKHEDA